MVRGRGFTWHTDDTDVTDDHRFLFLSSVVIVLLG